MTARHPRPGAPRVTPGGGKQPQAPPPREPQDQRGGRPPEYVIEIWASSELRERDQARPLSLSEALQAGRPPAPGKDPEPDLEPEIEP